MSKPYIADTKPMPVWDDNKGHTRFEGGADSS